MINHYAESNSPKIIKCPDHTEVNLRCHALLFACSKPKKENNIEIARIVRSRMSNRLEDLQAASTCIQFSVSAEEGEPQITIFDSNFHKINQDNYGKTVATSKETYSIFQNGFPIIRLFYKIVAVRKWTIYPLLHICTCTELSDLYVLNSVRLMADTFAAKREELFPLESII